MSAPPSPPGRGLPQAHLFGVFAPAMAPERRAALFATLAAAFPDGVWDGEDVSAEGFQAGLRWPRGARPHAAAIARAEGGLALGLVELIRRPDGAPPDALAAPSGGVQGAAGGRPASPQAQTDPPSPRSGGAGAPVASSDAPADVTSPPGDPGALPSSPRTPVDPSSPLAGDAGARPASPEAPADLPSFRSGDAGASPAPPEAHRAPPRPQAAQPAPGGAGGPVAGREPPSSQVAAARPALAAREVRRSDALGAAGPGAGRTEAQEGPASPAPPAAGDAGGAKERPGPAAPGAAGTAIGEAPQDAATERGRSADRVGAAPSALSPEPERRAGAPLPTGTSAAQTATSSPNGAKAAQGPDSLPHGPRTARGPDTSSPLTSDTGLRAVAHLPTGTSAAQTATPSPDGPGAAQDAAPPSHAPDGPRAAAARHAPGAPRAAATPSPPNPGAAQDAATPSHAPDGSRAAAVPHAPGEARPAAPSPPNPGAAQGAAPPSHAHDGSQPADSPHAPGEAPPAVPSSHGPDAAQGAAPHSHAHDGSQPAAPHAPGAPRPAAPPPPQERRSDLQALAAALCAAPAAPPARGPLAGFEGRYVLALLRPAHPGAGPGRPGHAPPGPRLDLLRDAPGRLPLWTAEGPEGALLFSSRPQALLAAPGVSRAPDPLALAMLLAFRETGPGRAAHAGLSELPPGAALAADARPPRLRPTRRPGPDPALLGLAPAEALEALEARLRAAVHDRLAAAEALGRPWALEFSGGLDSALIACIAAERGPVPGFANVAAGALEGDDYNAGAERAARAALAARLPQLRVTETAPDADFLAGAAHYLDRAAMPCPDPTAFAALGLAEAMAEAGALAAMNGFGGDFSLSSHARPSLPELWRAGGPGAAWAELRARRELGGRLRNILIGDLVKPSAAFRLWMRARPGAADPILAPGMAADPGFRARMAEAGRRWRHPRGWSMAAEEAAEIARLPAWTVQDLAPLSAGTDGGGGGLSRLTPLLDADLVDAVLAMPPALRLFPAHDLPGGALPRGLARRLLAPRAPEIAARPDKAPFQPDYARRQAEAVPRLRAEARAFRALPEWRAVVNEPAWDAALDAAERADVREGVRLSNRVMGPFFLGWWLLRATGAG